jgi:hypothetical protein
MTTDGKIELLAVNVADLAQIIQGMLDEDSLVYRDLNFAVKELRRLHIDRDNDA